MVCICGHDIRDHEWNFVKGKPEPCTICDCPDYIDESRGEKMDMSKIVELGDRVVDTITGFKGCVTAKIVYMYDCTQYLVQPKAEKKNGAWVSAKWIDEPQLKITKKGTYKAGKPKFGGMREHP